MLEDSSLPSSSKSAPEGCESKERKITDSLLQGRAIVQVAPLTLRRFFFNQFLNYNSYYIRNRYLLILASFQIPAERHAGVTSGGKEETQMYGLKQNFARLWCDERGVSSVEYALLLAFVTATVIVAAGVLSNAVQNEITGAADCIDTNGATC